MRFYKNPQGKLGEITISEIKLDSAWIKTAVFGSNQKFTKEYF